MPSQNGWDAVSAFLGNFSKKYSPKFGDEDIVNPEKNLIALHHMHELEFIEHMYPRCNATIMG